MSGDEWIRIRRVGGENDQAAKVVVEYQPAGEEEFIMLGEEPISSNFSSEWNLRVYRTFLGERSGREHRCPEI